MDTTFWVVSKITWGLVAPETLLLVFLILGVGLLWTRHHKTGRLVVSVIAVIFASIAILPLSTWLLRPLEERFAIPIELPDKVDGVIVLAGAENISVTKDRGQPSLHGGGERLTTFVWLAQIFPDAILLFAGGSGHLTNQINKSADTAREIFEQMGLDSGRVQFESDSKNTSESAIKAYRLIQPQPHQSWILVTSAFHMPRSVGVFRKVGWNVIPYPVDFYTTKRSGLNFDLREIGRFSQGIREWMGILIYRAAGKTSELFPGPSTRQ